MLRWSRLVGARHVQDHTVGPREGLRGYVKSYIHLQAYSKLFTFSTGHRGISKQVLAHLEDVQGHHMLEKDACIFQKEFYGSDRRLMLKNLNYTELEDWCKSIGESPRRAHQLWRWMYYDMKWIPDFKSALGLQDGFGSAFVEKASELATLDGGLRLQSIHRASDGTQKMVFNLTGLGSASMAVEAVLIPIVRRGGQRARTTLCISSQVGCAQNCQFCFTGRMGLLANLSTAQIIEQVVAARRLAHEIGLERTAPINQHSLHGDGRAFGKFGSRAAFCSHPHTCPRPALLSQQSARPHPHHPTLSIGSAPIVNSRTI
eukprot:jgi/Botrbrau1/17487/Bobra.0054s0070.1